jgi:hypothetical protein
MDPVTAILLALSAVGAKLFSMHSVIADQERSIHVLTRKVRHGFY